MKMDGDFLVTGAAQGFGKEFTKRVLSGGGRVMLSDKNKKGGEETTKGFQEEFGSEKCRFQDADVSSKEDWEQLWDRAAEFFGGKVDVLVNNAGVSPVLPFEIVMKVNLDGVLLGCNLMAARQSELEGGPGGLVINVASVAGLTYGMDRNSISYQISKHAVVDLTRSYGGPKVAKKTGIKHVALCPWFADTGILDGLDKSKIKKQAKLDFVTVERVGEAFEQVVKDQRSGSLMMIMPGCPLTYFPDVTMLLFFFTFLLSKASGLVGVTVMTTKQFYMFCCVLLLFLGYFMHFILNYCGI